MLENERSSHETDNNDANGHARSAAEPASASPPPVAPATPSATPPAAAPAGPAVPAAVFQAPQVLFQPPASAPAPAGGGREAGSRDSSGGTASGSGSGEAPAGESAGGSDSGRTGRAARGTRGGRGSRGARGGRDSAQDDDLFSAQAADSADATEPPADADADAGSDAGADGAEEGTGARRRRRRSGRGRGRADGGDTAGADGDGAAAASDDVAEAGDDTDEGGDESGGEMTSAGRRRRRKRRRGSGDSDVSSPDDPPDTVVHVREPSRATDDVRAIKGSTRLEAKKQRRREGRESGRRRPPVITESEFLARRESVERTMIVRQRGDRTQIAVLEDGVLVEHYVNRTTHASYVGNVYLGKVQNVLPSMEAAFVDIGKGRNAVLYAGEVNFDASGLEGQPKRIESALKPGQSVIVQVTKDPVGHKGARLTSMISLPGRYLVYVPGASMTGISRKLPDTERNRLKSILKKVTPEDAGVIVRTAAEGAAEAELDRDVTRLAAQWETIEKKAKTATAPALLYGEPDLTIRVVRDVFNEDFGKLIVSGDDGWDLIDEYVRYVAPHLADRLSRWEDAPESDGEDVFAAYRIDEQLAKALERKVWLPSGGSLVIDKTEAMTVIDVNTGKFTGQGGNLEETVTRNNLEAAEEIVRQLRLRDVGGIVVIDFIDMVLESNRELVLRRLLECLARDRTKHQVAEVTSLGLVQMTRKRVGAGLLEAFSQPCECCNGRGVIITLEQPEPGHRSTAGHPRRPVPGPGNGPGNGQGSGRDSGRDSANGRGGRSAQDRPPREDDEDAAKSANGDEPAEAGRGRGSQGGRRGRRDGRTTTNGGTASASLVEAVEAPLAATPVPVPDSVPAFVTPVADAATEAGAPVRRTRTRAGSAMARLAAPAEPAPAEVPLTDATLAEVAPAKGAPAEAAPVEAAQAEAPLADTTAVGAASAAPTPADAPPAGTPVNAASTEAAPVGMPSAGAPSAWTSSVVPSPEASPAEASPAEQITVEPQVPAVPEEPVADAGPSEGEALAAQE